MIGDRGKTALVSAAMICAGAFLLVGLACAAENASVIFGPKCVPPEGKTFLFIGQDLETFERYIEAAGMMPAGFMAYTSIQGLEGLHGPIDYGAGVQHLQYYIEHYKALLAQIGLYMVGGLDAIASGRYDDNIDTLGRWIKDAERPVFLRIGYEFDFPANNYDPQKYKRAYRYIVDRLRAGAVKNAIYVWHSYASDLSRPVTDWYPGDDYVDWVGASYFKERTTELEEIAALADSLGKPFMIAEATPYGAGTDAPWDTWFGPFFAFVEEKDVKAVCYINGNWEDQSLWKGQGWGDARVQADHDILVQWIDVIRGPRYQW